MHHTDTAGPPGPIPAWNTRLERADLKALLSALDSHGYRVRGPVMRDGALAIDEVRRVEALPIGWSDTQAAGRYRVEKSGGEPIARLFAT